MPVHDWTRVEAGIFHDFHVTWIPRIKEALNSGLLPEGFYALAEQHAGSSIADVLTLHASPAPVAGSSPPPTGRGGTAVAEAPPRVRRHETLDDRLLSRRRSLAIRHVSGHRLVAILEVISPANKDRPQTLADFAAKVTEVLDAGVHVLVVDLGEPLTLASYSAGRQVEMYLEHLAVGGILPDMPLFLHSDRYVNVPLEATYQAAYQGVPGFWRDVLEGRGPASRHG